MKTSIYVIFLVLLTIFTPGCGNGGSSSDTAPQSGGDVNPPPPPPPPSPGTMFSIGDGNVNYPSTGFKLFGTEVQLGNFTSYPMILSFVSIGDVGNSTINSSTGNPAFVLDASFTTIINEQ